MATFPTPQSRVADIAQYFRSIVRPDLHPRDLIEIRGWPDPATGKTGTAAGLFRDLNKAALAAVTLSDAGLHSYHTLNPVAHDSGYAVRLGHRLEKLNQNIEYAANATDIVCRRFYFFDFDPERTPKEFEHSISTEEEKSAAWSQTQALVAFLTEQGWPLPIINDSGSGYHVLYAADRGPVLGKPLDQLRRILRLLHARYSTLDTSVSNPSRVIRVPHTMNVKGISTADRPHRMAQEIQMPVPLEVVLPDHLLALEFLLDPQTAYQSSLPKKKSKRSDLVIDEAGVEDFINEFPDQLDLNHISRKDGVTYFVLDYCPFKGCEHQKQGDKSAIVLSQDRIGFHCFSDDCIDYHFSDLLRFLHEETGRWPKARFWAGMTDAEAEAKWGCSIDDLSRIDLEREEARLGAEAIKANSALNVFYSQSRLLKEFATQVAIHEHELAQQCHPDLALLRSRAAAVKAAGDHYAMLVYLHGIEGAYCGEPGLEPTWPS